MRTGQTVGLRSARRSQGLSLTEVLIATAIASMVLASVASLTLYGARSSLALTNYTNLEAKSGHALDVISRELRQATAVTGFQTNGTVRWLALTNATDGVSIALTNNTTARTLVLAKTGQDPLPLLTECDQWNFGLYQRTPWVTSTNTVFYPATNVAGVLDPSLCKLVSLSWKCSRTILAQKVNTESDQAAQIVLRSKQ